MDLLGWKLGLLLYIMPMQLKDWLQQSVIILVLLRRNGDLQHFPLQVCKQKLATTQGHFRWDICMKNFACNLFYPLPHCPLHFVFFLFIKEKTAIGKTATRLISFDCIHRLTIFILTERSIEALFVFCEANVYDCKIQLPEKETILFKGVNSGKRERLVWKAFYSTWP